MTQHELIPFINYYSGGSEKTVTQMMGGRPHGLYERFSKNGTLECRRSFDHGKNTGLVQRFTKGVLTQQSFLENGVLNGPFLEFYSSGTLKRIIYYVNGTINGPAKIFFEDGRLQVEMSYQNGHIHGDFKEYNADGTIKIRACYENGLLHGSYQEFDPFSKITGQYVHGKKDGEFITVDSNGTKLKPTKTTCFTANKKLLTPMAISYRYVPMRWGKKRACIIHIYQMGKF